MQLRQKSILTIIWIVLRVTLPFLRGRVPAWAWAQRSPSAAPWGGARPRSAGSSPPSTTAPQGQTGSRPGVRLENVSAAFSFTGLPWEPATNFCWLTCCATSARFPPAQTKFGTRTIQKKHEKFVAGCKCTRCNYFMNHDFYCWKLMSCKHIFTGCHIIL